jgi:hypothetical protein
MCRGRRIEAPFNNKGGVDIITVEERVSTASRVKL